MEQKTIFLYLKTSSDSSARTTSRRRQADGDTNTHSMWAGEHSRDGGRTTGSAVGRRPPAPGRRVQPSRHYGSAPVGPSTMFVESTLSGSRPTHGAWSRWSERLLACASRTAADSKDLAVDVVYDTPK